MLNPSIKKLMFEEFLLRNVTNISHFCTGYHICRRKSDLESLGEVEHIPLLLSTDLNKIPMGTNKEGTSMRYESKDSSL